MKVKDCMCSDVKFVTPDTTLCDCAKLMCNSHIGCVPVCDSSNYLVGVITDRDIILRSLACDKQAQNTTASEIMTCNVCTCNQDDDVKNAEKKMAENQIRRIPVVACNVRSTKNVLFCAMI